MANNGDLRLDYEGMASASKKLIKESEDFDNCITNMRNVINSLPDIWAGKASVKYMEQFDDLEPSFKETKELIEKLAAQMDSIVKAMQDSDQAVADQVGVGKA